MVPSLGDKRTRRESTPFTKVKEFFKCCTPENERDKIGEQVDNCYDERFSCQDSEDACDSAYDACIDKINWPCASQDEKLDACIDKNKKLDAFYESIDEYAKTKETLTKLGIDYGNYFDE